MTNTTSEPQTEISKLSFLNRILQSEKWLAFFVIAYAISNFPLNPSIETILASIGGASGRLIATYFVASVISNFSRWEHRSTKLYVLTFILATLFQFMQLNQTLSQVLFTIFVLSLPILLIQTIISSPKKKSINNNEMG